MGGGFPIGTPSWRPRRRRVGMVPARTARTYGGNPLATGVPNAVLERPPGAGLHRRRARARRVPEGPARRPGDEASQGPTSSSAAPASCRACAARCRRATWSNRLQSLGLLVAAGRRETLIRVFPALIADKAALDEGNRHPEQGRTVVSRSAASRCQQGPPSSVMAEPKHFLDLDQVDPKTLRPRSSIAARR